MKIDIKHRSNSSILFSIEAGSMRLAVEAAVKDNASLSGADLRGANLSGANLGGAYLRDAYLRDVDLSDANLSDADLRGADLIGANLSDADLSDADLGGAYLRDADLRRMACIFGPDDKTYLRLQEEREVLLSACKRIAFLARINHGDKSADYGASVAEAIEFAESAI